MNGVIRYHARVPRLVVTRVAEQLSLATTRSFSPCLRLILDNDVLRHSSSSVKSGTASSSAHVPFLPNDQDRINKPVPRTTHSNGRLERKFILCSCTKAHNLLNQSRLVCCQEMCALTRTITLQASRTAVVDDSTETSNTPGIGSTVPLKLRF